MISLPTVDKVSKWKQKLLDLSKRNRLLSFKETKRSTVNITKPGIEALFDEVANANKPIEFVLRNPDINSLNFDEEESTNSLKDISIKNGQVLTNKSDKELLKSLHQLRQKANTAMQEQGVNVLYLAFGFLEWTEVAYSNIILKSPVILVPVSLKLESVLDTYKLEMIDEDIVVNPILKYKLESDFGIIMDEISDDDDWNVVDYLSNLKKMVSARGWSVVNEVQLSLFSFLKLNMYKDIERYSEKMAEHSIIKAISGDDSDIATVPDDIIIGKDFDEIIKPIDTFQVIDADSSQQQAIIAAKKGISFILQGPPGTGKSQTITNIIAECLASGKKVLFVSEKMAALEVVYRRLAEVGLTDFCLQLHSHKANKKDVISELGRTLNLSKVKVLDGTLDQFDQLTNSIISLNNYVNTIHIKQEPLGKSIYQIHGRLAKCIDAPELKFDLQNIGKISSYDLSNYERLVGQFADALKKIGDDYHSNPWTDCNVKILLFEEKNELEIHFKSLSTFLNEMLELSSIITRKAYLKRCSTLQQFQNLRNVLKVAEDSQQPPKDWFYFSNIDNNVDECENYKAKTIKFHSDREYINRRYRPEVFSENIKTIYEKLIPSINKVLSVINPEFASDINVIMSKRNELLGNLTQFIDVAQSIRIIVDKIAVAIGVPTAEYMTDVNRFILLGTILQNKINPTKSWFDNSKFIEVKRFIEIAEKSYEKLIGYEQSLFSKFNNNVINVNTDELKKIYNFDYSKYFRNTKSSSNFGSSDDSTSSCINNLVDNRNQIARFLPQLIDFCDDLSHLSENITKSIGVDIKLTLNESERLLRIGSLVSRNVKPMKNWFERGNIIKIIDYASECEDAYDTVRTSENSIFEMFDKDILGINYNDLLKRFKTEYISILRFMKPRYHADVKEIRAYAKNPRIKLSVNYIIDLLQKIKNLNERRNWIISNNSKMTETFGLWFNDNFTKWSEVKESLSITKDIIDFFNGDVPTKLISVSVESGTLFQKVCTDTKQLQTLLEKADIINFCRGWMPYEEEVINTQISIDEISVWAKKAFELSNSLFESYDEIRKFLIDPQKRLYHTEIINDLNQIESIVRKVSWISENERLIADYMGKWHEGRLTDWDSLKFATKQFDSIIDFFSKVSSIPDKLESILISEDDKIIILRSDFTNLGTAFKQWEEATYSYSKISNVELDLEHNSLDNITVDVCKIKESTDIIFDSLDCVTAYLKSNSEVIFSDIIEDMVVINNSNDIANEINDNTKDLGEKYNIYFSGVETDWDRIIKLLNWVKLMKATLGENNCSDQFISVVCDSTDIINDFSKWNEQLGSQLASIVKEITCVEGMFDSKKFDFYADDIESIIHWLNDCVSDFKRLEDWIDFKTSKEKCIENNLFGFVEEAYKNNVKSKDIISSFLKRFYKLWLNHIYSQCPVMMSFRGTRHEDMIKLFRVLDKDQFKIAQSRIRELLSAKRPNPNAMTSRGSEVSILQRELSKKRKIMPLRKLFMRIPNMLFALKPCLLMSPLSVSLFLDPDYYKFDVVIFDEASQICTEDAIGTIYRAEQCIVVGDKEQLPPTNFFNTSTGDTDFDNDSDDDEDEDDDSDAYESILDECSTALNKLTLQWHYRSRHEHLIAFSNAKIYGNLITFPSSLEKKEDFGVEYIEVTNGVYDRSKTRANKIEAQRVAKLIFEHFRKYPNRSLGVVAFSEAQQNTIEAEVRKLRLDNPFKFEQYFKEDKHEPFFIKNLENVQGDERDTIIFSIGYAKDQNGLMHMNFGPLSKQGGYRRLNVAITRARDNVKLVGSIKPTDIDLERASSQGVKMLRQYIDFAINGPKALEAELSVPGFEEFDSPFEEEVYKLLCDRGYKVDTQVGCSGYRIDMALRHPELSGVYTIGIECDGATYHSARTARERDRLREEVLRARGWNIHRIWSTDWVKNPKSEVERLIKAIEDSFLTVENEIQASQTNNIHDIELNEESDDEKLSNYQDIEAVISPMSAFDTEDDFDEYIVADIYSVNKDYSKTDMQYVADVLTYVVNTEGPIHFDILARRVAPLFGKGRAGSQTKRYINHVLQMLCRGKIIKKDDFCWSVDMECPKARKPIYGDSPRNVEHICTEEIAEAMLTIITKSVGLDWSILLSETARVLGFNRTGGKIQDAMMIAVDYLVSKNKVVINNDIVSIA